MILYKGYCIMKCHTDNFFRYSIVNSVYEAIDGTDSLRDARILLEKHKEEDRANGFLNLNYRIMRTDSKTGELLREIY